MATFEEMNPGSVKTDGHAERKCLGLPDTEATPDHLRGTPQHCDGGSSYNEFWDTGFAGEGDPYGIGAEYVSQSANPDAAKFTPIIPPQDAPVPDSAALVTGNGFTITPRGENLFSLDKDGVNYGDFLTYEDAEKALTIAEAH